MVADTVAIMESNMVADMEVDNVAIYIYYKYQKYKSVELADQLSLPTSLRVSLSVKRPFFYDFPKNTTNRDKYSQCE